MYPNFLARRIGRRAPAADRLRITDLRHGDAGTLVRVFEGLSQRSRYQRFHVGLASLPRASLHRLVDVRPGGHVAHVGWLGSEPVGLVRWIRLSDDTGLAELAIEVIDRVQGRGVGKALLDRAASSAAAAGIRVFQAFVAPGNDLVLEFALGRGATVDPDDSSALCIPVRALWADPTSALSAGDRAESGRVIA